MEPHILNTPQSIYETVTTHFPKACVKVQVQKTEAIAIKIFLNSDLPAIDLYGAVCESVLELRLQRIKVLQALNKPLLPSDLDCSKLSMERPFTEWQSFSRTAYERGGGCYVNLIAGYLNNSTQEAEQKLLDLGLAPDQVCRDGYLLSDRDLSYFRHILDKDLRFNVKMQAKYPGIFEQIQDQAIEEDLQNKPPSHYLIQLEEQQLVISTAGVDGDSDGIQSQTSSLEIAPCAVPIPVRIRTWPNLHSLFALATLVSNVACLVFPNPISIGINITIRCASIAFAIYAVNKAKISADIVSIVAILAIRNGSMAAIVSDLTFEAINFNRCEVSREFLKSRFNSFFNKTTKPPLDISRFIKTKLTLDPTVPENACKILDVPIEQIDNQDFIEMKYNSTIRERLLTKKKNLDTIESPIAPQIQRQIDYRDAAYKTLKERNEANSK